MTSSTIINEILLQKQQEERGERRRKRGDQLTRDGVGNISDPFADMEQVEGVIPRDEVIGGPLERVLAGLSGFYGDDDDSSAVPFALRPALPHRGLRSATSTAAEGEKGRREGEGREGVKEEAPSLQRSNRDSERGGRGGGRRPI